jgi:hypothetical protein
VKGFFIDHAFLQIRIAAKDTKNYGLFQNLMYIILTRLLDGEFALMKNLIFLLLLSPLFCGFSQPFSEFEGSGIQTGIFGRVYDAATKKPLPSRIVCRGSDGQMHGSYYQNFPGYFTEQNGSFKMALPAGEYTLEFFHGFDFLSKKRQIVVDNDQLLEINVELEPWAPLRQRGWVNGDGHAHLYTEKTGDEEMLQTVSRICRAQGVDFLCTNQGWAGYDDESWREGYGKYSDDQFSLFYGAEMPKYRTGHIWWLGLNSTHGYFSASMDSMYENRYYQTADNPHWDFDHLPFPNIPDVQIVPQIKRAENALACIPHPTSWWWEKRGELFKYTTNVCSYLAFSLLAGNLWDTLVVMGYDADHYFYQNLWFHVLNTGYRMTPVAELDGGYGASNKFPYGKFRVYYQTGEELTMQNVTNAARHGRTFVTSGPIVFAVMDDDKQVGEDFPADGQPHTLNIEAYASGESDDYLTYLIIFRNGEIHQLDDLRQGRPRFVRRKIVISEQSRAWYVVKAYGRNTQPDPQLLDVMSVCAQIEEGRFSGAFNDNADVCMTSPFYFWPDETAAPSLLSEVKLQLVDPVTGMPVTKATVQITLNGQPLQSLKAAGDLEFQMPVNAMLRIQAEGYPEIYRGLYLDYQPHRKLIENLANGDWLARKRWKEFLQPGQVPWEAFQFEKTKELLSRVEWVIPLEENERDPLWRDFYKRFE